MVEKRFRGVVDSLKSLKDKTKFLQVTRAMSRVLLGTQLMGADINLTPLPENITPQVVDARSYQEQEAEPQEYVKLAPGSDQVPLVRNIRDIGSGSANGYLAEDDRLLVLERRRPNLVRVATIDGGFWMEIEDEDDFIFYEVLPESDEDGPEGDPPIPSTIHLESGDPFTVENVPARYELSFETNLNELSEDDFIVIELPNGLQLHIGQDDLTIYRSNGTRFSYVSVTQISPERGNTKLTFRVREGQTAISTENGPSLAFVDVPAQEGLIEFSIDTRNNSIDLTAVELN